MGQDSNQHTVSLRLDQLSCQRDERILFSGLNAQINSGDVVQVLGPNGSGKTTLLRCLVSLAEPSSGHIYFDGNPLSESLFEFRRQLLYLGHLPGIKSTLSPSENLRWYAGLEGDKHGVQERIDHALSQVGLYGYEDQRCCHLSAGQQRRVGLARLYLSHAKIWVLDEPLTAIDKAGVAKLEQRFIEHSAAGGIVVLTTHQDLQLDGLKRIDLQDFMPGADELFGSRQ